MIAPSQAGGEGEQDTSAMAMPPVRDRFPWVAGALFVAATFAWYCVWRHFMAERSSDEAYFENCLWNATHGNGLRTWIEGEEGRGQLHLALHFSPLIYLLVPFYKLFPSMHVVHFLISVGTAAAGHLFYGLARGRVGIGPARLLTVAMLLHPTIVLQTFMEAHEQAFAPFPLMLLFLAYRRGATALALAGGLLFVAAREENALLVLVLAALAAVVRRDLRLAGVLLVLGAGWLGLYAWLSVNVFGAGQVSHTFAAIYGHFGDTPGQVVLALLRDPLGALRHALAPAPLAYLAQLLLPFLVVLPFTDPLVVAMLPQLALNLLAGHETRVTQIRMHYTVVPVLVMYAASVTALARAAGHPWRLGARSVSGARLLAAAMLALSLLGVPVWMRRAVQRLHPEREQVARAIAAVPDTASITAPGFVLNQMARRRLIAKTWSGPLTTTEYVLLEEPGRTLYEGRGLEAFFTPETERVLREAGYVPVYTRDGRHVWRRTTPLPPLPGSAPASGLTDSPRSPR